MKRVFWCLFFYCTLLQAEEKFIIISIGEDCLVTSALETHGLRRASSPFEFCITPCEALYKCLGDDFKDYVNPDFFTLYFDKQSPVNKYGIVLAHNFPLVSLGQNKKGEEIHALDPEWRKRLPAVQEKYQRRTNRFRSACTSGKKVYFVRYGNINSQWARKISDLLHAQYPDLDFDLICILNHSSPLDVERWNIPRVKNYYVNPSLDKGDLKGWRAILLGLGLPVIPFSK